ncbi:sugar ABC transporter ATP-binding protein [Grimontia marina]|uniref:Ribose import ATP-binding protein RbsA n=1 Tax=Grimontia marina TaxID=646534 RepID=A0A128EXE1_9GAMM|nr:sugar ABC transporter ATP-binding protein [Grimontia marina]CZF79258.1 Ribose import ATP-binding protein RbsA [Grimontia marina]
MTTAVPLLQLQNVDKRFGGNHAVKSVSLDIDRGEVVALLGENGAGKSTIIKILAGVYKADHGTIRWEGERISSARSLINEKSQPIAFIHQDLGLVEWMTVAENMALVMGFPKKLGFIDWGKLNIVASDALANAGISIDPEARVFDLSRTEKSLLAIARAIAVNAKILVLDEPTASLPADDVQHLFRVINRLRDEGVGMIYVTHRLDEVVEIADKICVMRDGNRIEVGNAKDYDIRQLVHLIVGEETKERVPHHCAPNSPTTLTCTNVVFGNTGPVSFSLRKGEMIALVGLRGAGQEDIGRGLFGECSYEGGHIFFNGKDYVPSDPLKAISNGISLVAGDRNNECLIPSMSVRENLFVNPALTSDSAIGFYGGKEEIGKAWWKVQLFDIRPKDVDIEVSALSGGNAQKVVIARWMDLENPLLILEDPTTGVDVGARSEIYDLLDKALEQGISVIVISSDLEEVSKICRRALVFERGRVVGELTESDVSFSNLLAMSMGSA